MKKIGCLVLVFNILLGGFCTQYVVNFWGSKIKGSPVHVPFLPCAVAGLVVGEIAIPVAVITWVVSYVI